MTENSFASSREYYASDEYARTLDVGDPLKHLRNEFMIPSRQDLKQKRLDGDDDALSDKEPCTYLCGNSLGLQPKLAAEYIQKYLQVWATKGVYGHFKPLQDQLSSPWVDIDEDPRVCLGKLVGAQPDEVAVMGTLTANLHLLMASFYRPTKEKWKIMIEGKAFPSDHYAVESQLRHHGFNPKDGLLLLEPPAPNPNQQFSSPILATPHILSAIDQHASELALILLPGVQFYTGQFLEIQRITAHARSLGIPIGWDLAHAVGNVPLQLHDWDVDFAAWCHYKYMNAGPGCIAGLFVHERHGVVNAAEGEAGEYTPRLSGWWGSDKARRFAMENAFRPIPGAAGWQVSNPSALDTTALLASLAVFEKTDISALREKSARITGYLRDQLHPFVPVEELEEWQRLFEIITPLNPGHRGAQLSLKLKPGRLDSVMEFLEEEGVVVDERRPDVVRVAPAPLYNTYYDAWRFVQVFKKAVVAAERKVGESKD